MSQAGSSRNPRGTTPLPDTSSCLYRGRNVSAEARRAISSSAHAGSHKSTQAKPDRTPQDIDSIVSPEAVEHDIKDHLPPISPDPDPNTTHDQGTHVDDPITYKTCKRIVDSAFVQWAAEQRLHEEALGRMVRQMLREELATFEATTREETSSSISISLTGYVPQSAFQDLKNEVSRLREIVGRQNQNVPPSPQSL